MKKTYLINDDHYDCHENYKPYGKDKGLTTLGYALVAVERRKESFQKFITNADQNQESLDLRCCFSPEMEITLTRDKNQFVVKLHDGWYEPAIQIEQSAFINLAQDFLHITKFGPDVVELIQKEDGSFSLFYQQ